MPGRKTPLITGEIYHVFNRGINRQPTFTNSWEKRRAILTLKFYRFSGTPVRLSILLSTSSSNQKEVFDKLENSGTPQVNILSYCLMPNHFHLLLRQKQDNGISIFLGNFQNSYTKYFNARNKRDGSLFLDQFKALRIETDEQLLQVARYIHLNPYSSYLVDSFDNLLNYPYSSLGEYLKTSSKGLCEKETILSFFQDLDPFKKFILDNADYQRSLEQIKHLLFE